MVQQKLKELNIRWDARTDISIIEEMFRDRNEGKKISISKAFERNFALPQTPEEVRIAQDIRKFRIKTIAQLESDFFSQKTRFNKAVEILKTKTTKKAQNDLEVSERQIARLQKRLEKFKSDAPAANDSRIYAFDYAPVIVIENGERVIKPMRYHLRPPGMPETFDRKYPGCYNARKDSLTGFWQHEFGYKHGIMILTSFFENVNLHTFEKRELGPEEAEKNIVIEFKPEGLDFMVVPCIYDHWGDAKNGFYSFALITDDPPSEVFETGHDRCPIFLNENRMDDWLKPEGKTQQELLSLLDDRQRPFYKVALAG
jgi:putative SOS response-associated peptidase YedK